MQRNERVPHSACSSVRVVAGMAPLLGDYARHVSNYLRTCMWNLFASSLTLVDDTPIVSRVAQRAATDMEKENDRRLIVVVIRRKFSNFLPILYIDSNNLQ